MESFPKYGWTFLKNIWNHHQPCLNIAANIRINFILIPSSNSPFHDQKFQHLDDPYFLPRDPVVQHPWRIAGGFGCPDLGELTTWRNIPGLGSGLGSPEEKKSLRIQTPPYFPRRIDGPNPNPMTRKVDCRYIMPFLGHTNGHLTNHSPSNSWYYRPLNGRSETCT